MKIQVQQAKMFSRWKDGKEEPDKTRKGRSVRKLSSDSTPRSIVVPKKAVDPGRQAFIRAKTTSDIFNGQQNRGRAISPGTIKRMKQSLGLIPNTIVSAPTTLNKDAESVLSVHSEPRLATAPKDFPRVMGGKTAKRHSIEYGSHRNFKNTSGHQSMRSLGLPRKINSSAYLRVNGRAANKIESVGVSTCGSLCTQQLVSKRKSNDVKANVKIPEGKVSVVITDIQGSTMMWEQNASVMKDALDIHDTIIRKCYVKQGGYEITTEGDSFHLAFHHPLDALSFCLDCQHKLFNANWSQEILELSNAKFDSNRAMRGLRVRMGIHHGPTTSKIHVVTKRTYYNGEGLELAKAMEKASHGGQIVTNVETWRAVSGMAERYLGSPQVLDLGVHELQGKGDTVYTKSLVQLVPKRYAFDYFTFRGTMLHKNHERPEGRTFPPPKTLRQIGSAFFDAPYLNNKVTIVFVNTFLSGDTPDMDDSTDHSKKLAQMIRSLLIRTNPPGYECQEDNGSWMLAFHSLETSILFGLYLIDKLEIAKSPLVTRVGVHHGLFTSMGPHIVTGKAGLFYY